MPVAREFEIPDNCLRCPIGSSMGLCYTGDECMNVGKENGGIWMWIPGDKRKELEPIIRRGLAGTLVT